MRGKKRVKTNENDLPDDPELNKLFTFIKKTLSGKNSRKRTISTDKEYHFTIHITVRPGVVIKRVVPVAAGQTLYLHRGRKGDNTNSKAFMVDEDEHAWHVDGETGVVRYFKDNHFTGRLARGAHEKMRLDGSGLSLR